jgi:hypothetical protein
MAHQRCAVAGAAMLLAAGLGGPASLAYADELDSAAEAALDPAAVPERIAPPSHDANPLIAAARGGMAGWKPVEQERLGEMRGGFDAAGLQVSFGIEHAVVINGALVATTNITIPDVSKITIAQANQLAATLGPTIVAQTNAAVSAALGSSAISSGSSASTAGSAGTSATTTASAAGASAVSNGAPGVSTVASAATGAVPVSIPTGSVISSGAAMTPSVVATATGQVVSNGLMTVIQNGAGNVASLGAAGGAAGTVIQNTLNNQNIQNLVAISTSVNSLQAFRAAVANSTLNSALLNAAAMR